MMLTPEERLEDAIETIARQNRTIDALREANQQLLRKLTEQCFPYGAQVLRRRHVRSLWGTVIEHVVPVMPIGGSHDSR